MSEELLTALETERRYMARELHDSIAQTTLQLGLQAHLATRLLERNQLDQLADLLAELSAHIQKVSRQVRELIADLRPPEIDRSMPLPHLLQFIIDVHHQRGGPQVEFRFEWSEPYPVAPGEPAMALLRICQEALLNVRKHAHAQTVHFMLTQDDAQFYLSIADDGRGFDPVEVAERPGDKGGAGLQNLQTRARALGGEAIISRNVFGSGTKITVTWPRTDL